MKLHPVAYGLALATLAVHLTFNHRYGFYRDELYFIDCARHLAWGYVDQPPLVPAFVWMTAPLGYALWALRLLPAVLAAFTVLISCAIARELRGGAFAQALTAVAVALAPGLLGLGYGLSTEALSPATWSALVFLTMRLVRTGDQRLYLAMALIVSVGMSAKYSIAACALALALGLLLAGKGALLRSRMLALGIGLVVLLTLPNVLWQLGHGLPMLDVIHGDRLNRHALANGVADESAQLGLNAAYMLAAQVLYQNPVLSLLWVGGLWALAFGRDFAEHRFLAIAYALLLSLIVITVGRGYYIEGIYPALFAAGSVALERRIENSTSWIRPAALLIAIAAGVIVMPLALPIFHLAAYMRYERIIGLSRPMPPDGQRHLTNPLYADQLGWKTMTQTVAQAYYALPAVVRAHTPIFADRYAYAGALDYYGPRYGLPAVISPNNSYYLWGTRGYNANSLLAVGATDYQLLLQSFASVRQVAVYRNQYRWILEGPLPIYLCTRPRASLAAMWPKFKYYGL